MNPEVVFCRTCDEGTPYLPGQTCRSCNKSYEDAILVANNPYAHYPALAQILGDNPSRSTKKPDDEEHATIASVPARLGVTSVSEVQIMEDTQDLLSARSPETFGWVWMSSGSQRTGAAIPGVAFIPMRRDATGDSYLDLTPHHSSTLT